MIYVVNLDLHTAHTVKPMSKTEREIKENPEHEVIFINGCAHKIFHKVEDARAFLSLLMLHGTQN